MRVGFVILHYKVKNITEECIDLLLQQDYIDYNIVVVDNNSDNGSFEYLISKYDKHSNIYFVSLESNYGFAKANDVGYQIAKHKFNDEIIIVINNDLMIKDNYFCKKVVFSYKNNAYDILGPDIINKIGEHQNPLINCVKTKKELNSLIFKTRIKLMLVPLLYDLLPRKKRKQTSSLYIDKKVIGIPLHGSCLIFGKKFICTHEFPFYPETFLYGEEDILFNKSINENLALLYDPEIVVYHMEDVATDSLNKTSKEKRVFQLKNSLNSLLILKKIFTE